MNMTAIAGMIEGFERILRLEDRHAVAVDGTLTAKFPNSGERARLTTWLADEGRIARERRWSLGNAVIVTYGPARALLTAFNWIHRPVVPHVIKATEAEAVDWGCERLAAAGITLPPELLSMRAGVARRASKPPTRGVPSR
jgi:hypothetical protein